MLGKTHFDRKQGCLLLFIVVIMSITYPATADDVFLIKDPYEGFYGNRLGYAENKRFI